MSINETLAASDHGDAGGNDADDLENARAELIAAIDGAEPHLANERAEAPDGLAKVSNDGLSFELRLNGETIPLDGNDINELAPDDFKPFLERQKLCVEKGELDAIIVQAIAKPGPGKALARVRALGAA